MPDGNIQYWATDVEAPVFVFQRVSGARSMGTVESVGAPVVPAAGAGAC